MLPDNLTTFLDKHVWIKRIGVYASIFAGIVLAFIFIFAAFKLIFPDFSIINNTAFAEYNTTQLRNMGFFDNERYLISALVQSLAATIALVITLSLVAVQLAAQSYSARVIDVYKNNPDMWILLSIYIVVIFYGLGLLKVIDMGVAGINMEIAIFAAYFLGFFAFVCLVPYMLKTLDLLKPSKVIDLLAMDITIEKVMKALEDDGEITEKDPIQPIIDIINSSLERNDYETVRNGLIAIRKSTIVLMRKTNLEQKEFEKIPIHSFQHLQRAGEHALNRRNDDSISSSAKTIAEIAITSAKMKNEKVAIEGLKILKKMGIQTIVIEREMPTIVITKNITRLGLESIESEIYWTTKKTIKTLMEIGPESKLETTESVVKEIIVGLSNLASKIFEKDEDIEFRTEPEEVIENIVNALTKLGIVIAVKGMEGATLWAVGSIKKIGLKAADKDLEHITESTILSLKEIQKISINNKLLEVPKITADAIERLENIVRAQDKTEEYYNN